MPEIELDWIKKWAHYSPRRLALREHERDLQWTYRDFNQRVEALAAFLQNDVKIAKGQRIAVWSKNRAEYVFLFFACMKIGAILAPLNFRLTPAELDVLLRDAEPAVLFFEQDFAGAVGRLTALVPQTQRLAIEDLTSFLTDPVPPGHFTPDPSLTLDDLVMILYTSGTTGLPKGAMINHRMLFWNSINTALRLDLTSSDHTLSFAPFFHTGGWNVLLTPFIHHGASQTLLAGFDADLILQLLQKERVTLFFGVPTMMQMMADSHYFEQVDLSSVRYAVVGGAPMPIPLIHTWHEKGIPIRQGYGLTEVGPNTFSLHQDDAIRKKGSIGFPNFYIEARIVDEQGQTCPANEVGELWLKSPVVTPGYWRNEDETRRAITGGWFHTGDMVRCDDEGYYYVVDRKKNMFISGGENIYPAEIEQVLDSHPAIRESAVIGVADEKWGEVGLAFIVLEKGKTLAETEVIEHCRARLAKYKIPKHIRFIEVLPRNEAGKIDRKQLAKSHNH